MTCTLWRHNVQSFADDILWRAFFRLQIRKRLPLMQGMFLHTTGEHFQYSVVSSRKFYFQQGLSRHLLAWSVIDVHILLFLDPKKAGLNALGPARMGFRRFMKKRNTTFALTWLLTTAPPSLSDSVTSWVVNLTPTSLLISRLCASMNGKQAKAAKYSKLLRIIYVLPFVSVD